VFVSSSIHFWAVFHLLLMATSLRDIYIFLNKHEECTYHYIKKITHTILFKNMTNIYNKNSSKGTNGQRPTILHKLLATFTLLFPVWSFEPQNLHWHHNTTRVMV
jgi:hypothetical protein